MVVIRKIKDNKGMQEIDMRSLEIHAHPLFKLDKGIDKYCPHVIVSGKYKNGERFSYKEIRIASFSTLKELKASCNAAVSNPILNIDYCP